MSDIDHHRITIVIDINDREVEIEEIGIRPENVGADRVKFD